MLSIYKQFEKTPKEAQKEIKGGRLSGFTDINPMWRIKTMTQAFGPCGIGWKYTITDKRLETGANGEISAFVDIDLFYKHEGEWSEAIPGTGGSAFVAKERAGLRTSDECFKMALTDALSVAMKALGMSADIYFEKDYTKYTAPEQEAPQGKSKGKPLTKEQEQAIKLKMATHHAIALFGDEAQTKMKEWMGMHDIKAGKDITDFDGLREWMEEQANADLPFSM